MKIAVMGCGTVGSGVYEIIKERASLFAQRCGEEELEVKYILDIRDFDGAEFASKIVHDINVITEDPEIGVVAETMGGTEPAFTYCMKCINAGKSVVTSNKQLVAEKGEALMEAAKKNNVAFMFGASVCGGIPVIRTIFSNLSSNEITEFAGILNGTTNFILTKMIKEKMSFNTALRLAQENGYAEKDPTADIEGHDAARKTAILCSACFGSHFYPEEIKTEGITKITLEDAAYVDGVGGKIKLLGRGKKGEDGKIYAGVSPVVVDGSSMLAGVEGVFNAILIKASAVEEVLLYGPGAGKRPTASAVLADILECIRLGRNEPLYSWAPHKDGVCGNPEEDVTSFYVRGFSKNSKETLRLIRETFDGVKFLYRENAPENEIAFITSSGKAKILTENISDIKDFVPASVIRVM